MDLGMGPSVGLAIFYEIFYEKSIFFFEEKTNSKMARQYAGFTCFFAKIPRISGRGTEFIFSPNFCCCRN
ncbi:hypothetical protein ACQRBR_09240 [Desulfovibrio sp. SGI.133]